MAAPGGAGSLRTTLVRLGQIALTVAVTWLIVRQVGVSLADLRAFDSALLSPNPVLLAAASSTLLAAYFVSGAIWGRIVRELGGPRIPVSEAVRMFMIANLGRYIPGKVWQIAGLTALARGRGVPAVTAVGGAVLGQGLALIAASALGVLALLTSPPPFDTVGRWAATIVVGCTLLAALPGVFRRLADVWFRMVRAEAPERLDTVHGMRWLGLYVLNWGMYSLSFWMLTLGLGFDAALVPVASAFAAAYVIGYAMVFAPAGLGPREGFLIAFLTPQFGAVPSTIIALIARVWTTLVEVLPAGGFWLLHLTAAKDLRAATPGRTAADE